MSLSEVQFTVVAPCEEKTVVVVVVVVVVKEHLFLNFFPLPGAPGLLFVLGRFLTGWAVPEAPGGRKLRETFVVSSCVLVV